MPTRRHAADQKIHHRSISPRELAFGCFIPNCCFHRQPFPFHLILSSVVSQRIFFLFGILSSFLELLLPLQRTAP